MITTPIAIGQKYRTRNGHTACILDYDGEGLRPVTALIIDDGPLYDRYYTLQGMEHQPLAGEQQQESPYDLTELLP